MSEYVLSFRIIGSAKFEVPSSEEEHRLIGEGSEAFAEIQVIEQGYDSNVRNYIDYEVRRARFMMNHVMLNHVSEDIRSEMRDLARHFDNLLNSGSSSLNLIVKYLKSRGLSLTDAYDEWDRERTVVRQELPGFQAIEFLRNHSQHAGTSIYSITLEHRRSDPDSADWKLIRGLIPFAHIDHLVPNGRDPRMKGKNRAFFKASLQQFADPSQPDQIDLSTLVRQHMVGIGRLIEAFREIISPRETAWRAVHSHALARLTVPGAPNVAHIAALRNGDVYEDVRPMAKSTVETIDRLRDRNGKIGNLLRTEVRL